MSTFKEVRGTLAADLGVVGVPVIDDWPVRTEPPCIYLTPPISGSYVSEGKEFGTVQLHLDVLILVDAHPIGPARDELENLLEEVLRNSADWGLDGADPPGTASMPDSTVEFLGTVVHLGKTIYLSTGGM